MSSTAIWITWLVVVLASFGYLEWWRIRKEGTAGALSYLFWRILFTDHGRLLVGKHPRRPRPVIYFLVLGPFVWLLLHFFLGGRLG